MQKLIAMGVAISIVFLISFVVLYLKAGRIGLVREGGVHIATRVMGIVLSPCRMSSKASPAITNCLEGTKMRRGYAA